MMLLFTGLSAQQDQFKWTFKTEKVNDSIAELVMTCRLQKGWHIYSQKTKGTEMPIEFSFEPSKDYQRIGGVREPKYLAKYDK